MTINIKKASGKVPVEVNFIVPTRIAYAGGRYIPAPNPMPRVTIKRARPIAKLAAAWLL